MTRQVEGRLPVILHVGESWPLDAPKETKLLICKKWTPVQFMKRIRDTVVPKIKSHQALFMFIGKDNILPTQTSSFSELYEKHASEDGVLHITLQCENTFGKQ